MHWYHTFEIIECGTPSRNDDIDFETESRYRKEGARFIMELGNKLGLRYLTMATGIVFYHRFYMIHSFKAFSRWVTGATCLFLAGKVEETPKKCRDILKYAQQMLTDSQFKTFGDNPREELMICERILLQTIKFDLQTSHPYEFLIKYGKSLKGDKSKINEFVQKAWIFINDSLSTPLCLVYQPQIIALAVLLLAFKMSKQDIREYMHKSRVEWWKSFHSEATENDLEEICKDLMNLYEGKPPRRRFPSKHKLRNDKKLASAGNSPMPSSNDSPRTPNSPLSKKQKKLPSSSVENTPTLSVRSNSSDEFVKQTNENGIEKVDINKVNDNNSQLKSNLTTLDNNSSEKTSTIENPKSNLIHKDHDNMNVAPVLSQSPTFEAKSSNNNTPSSRRSTPSDSSLKSIPNTDNIKSSTLQPTTQIENVAPVTVSDSANNISTSDSLPLMPVEQPSTYGMDDENANVPPMPVLTESQSLLNDNIPPPAIIPDVREVISNRNNSSYYQQDDNKYDQYTPNASMTQSMPNLPRLMFQPIPNQVSQNETCLPMIPQMQCQTVIQSTNGNKQISSIDGQNSYNHVKMQSNPDRTITQAEEPTFLPRGIQRVHPRPQNLPPPILDHMSSFFQSNPVQNTFISNKQHEQHQPPQPPLSMNENVLPQPSKIRPHRPLINNPQEQSPTRQQPYSPFQNQPQPRNMPPQQGYFQHQGPQQQFMNHHPNLGSFNEHRMQNIPQNFDNYRQMLPPQSRHGRGGNLRPPFPPHFQGGPWI